MTFISSKFSMTSVAVAYSMPEIGRGFLLWFYEQIGQSNLFTCSKVLKLLIEKTAVLWSWWEWLFAVTFFLQSLGTK